MPDGRLCKRKDRVKCPFHGKIIPRDPNGKMPEENKPKTKPAEIGYKVNSYTSTEHTLNQPFTKAKKTVKRTSSVKQRLSDKLFTKRKAK